MAHTDRDALVALYNATGGANWKQKTNWDTGVDLSQWCGIKVDEQGRVVELNLFWNNLQGSIPKELGALVKLEKLSLYGNKLTGPIPGALGALSQLEALFLFNNQLTGPIPPELGNLGALQALDLQRNQLTGPIPPELGNLTALKDLGLDTNQLGGPIPEALGALSELKGLWLSSNKLTGSIPPDLGKLGALKTLELWNNRLSGAIPANLGELVALKTLSLGGNQLSGSIPKELGGLTRLSTLVLSSNHLTGLWDIGLKSRQGRSSPLSTKEPLPSGLDSLLRVVEGCSQVRWGNNPWQYPPAEVMGKTISVHVRQYFNALLAGSVSTVRRPLKVVVVGKESVGKTSLRQSIVAGKARPTRNRAEKSTVHIDVEDHELDGRPIRIFDCAGQVAYTGLLQLFLTPQVIHLLVVDMPSVVGNIENGTANPLEDLGALRWVRSLSFRVPGAAVILVGTMCDRVEDTDGETKEARLSRAAGMVEDNIRSWIHKWTTRRLQNHQFQSIAFENGVSLVNCGLSCDALDGGWPCDVTQPSLLHRITYKDGKARGIDADLPLSWGCALSLLDETARRVRGQPGFRGIERTELDRLWHDKVDELKRGGHEVEATEHALDGAISIMAYEGSLVVYGSFVIVDVQWLATVLKPLCSHKDMSMGEVNLGGITVRPGPRVERLVKDGILEPKLAEELWPDTWEYLLRALSSAGLTFPRPNDEEGGLVVLLRLDEDRPDDVGDILDDFRATHDGRIVASCTLLQGAPPGFIERLLSTCCRLGSCNHFWRYGVLIQSRSFSVILEYAEDDDTLVGTFSVDAFGDSGTAGPWLALSGCLSVLSKMLSEFPGMDVEATLECPYHSGHSGLIPIDLYQRRPWQCFIREVDGCRRCLHEGEQNARHLFSRGLIVVPVTDSGFDTAGFTREFDDATTDFNEGTSEPRATVSIPPRPLESQVVHSMVRIPPLPRESQVVHSMVRIPPQPRESQQRRPASRTTVSVPLGPSAAPCPREAQARVPAQIEALFGDLEKAFTIIAGGCLAAFAGLASVYTTEVWAPFLVLGMVFSLAAAASVLRKWCWNGGRLDPRSATGFSDDTHQSPMNGFENV